MSKSQLVVAEARIDQRCEAARRAGDLAEMQRCMSELTLLQRAYYGAPPHPSGRRSFTGGDLNYFLPIAG